MKKFCIVFLFTLLSSSSFGQNPFYRQKISEFSQMRRVDSTDVVMVGDGLTEYAGDWNKLLQWRHIRNRGIAGDRIKGVASRLHSVLQGKPKALFLMAGTNDILEKETLPTVLHDYIDLINLVRETSPETKLYVQSLLPVNETFSNEKLSGMTNTIASFNVQLRHYCERHHVDYINIFKRFVRHGTNEMRRELTSDGLHLTPFGYKVWAFELKKYLLDLKP
ncbi:MAG: GDSL-type esterase/lipase family protein [Prevotella sp.]